MNQAPPIEEARAVLDAGDPDRALALLDDALQRTPDDAEGILLKTEALVVADRWEEAEEFLEEAARRLPREPRLLLALADLIVEFHPDDHAAIEEAFAIAVRAEAAAKKVEANPELLAELRFVAGRALSCLGRCMEALDALESARAGLNDDPDLLIELAMTRFEALQFEAARALLLAVLKERPKDARVHHYLGLVAERAGDESEAKRHFAEAQRLDPDEFPKGVHLSEDDFAAAVEKALAGLPERVREYLANVPVMVEDLPSVEELREQDPPLSPLSLGMFRGLPGAERSHFDPWSQLPSSIVLYQKNLERYAADRTELLEEIETTVLHEVGHYLGWDEDELYERSLD